MSFLKFHLLFCTFDSVAFITFEIIFDTIVFFSYTETFIFDSFLTLRISFFFVWTLGIVDLILWIIFL